MSRPVIWETLFHGNSRILNSEVVPAYYGVCGTDGATAEKTLDIENFALEAGRIVAVKFAEDNTAGSPTLNVSGTGAYPITCGGEAADASSLTADTPYLFVYIGGEWTSWTAMGGGGGSVSQAYVTLTSDLSSGTAVSTQGVSYTPGSNRLFVYYEGVKLIVGENYSETDSETVTLLFDAESGSTLEFVRI